MVLGGGLEPPKHKAEVASAPAPPGLFLAVFKDPPALQALPFHSSVAPVAANPGDTPPP